jgi:serine/threonine protein kinase
VSSFERISRSSVGALELIGEGGQAKVYKATELQLSGESRQLAFKEYYDKSTSISGLDRLATFRRRLSDRDREILDILANWPVRVVENEAGVTDGLIVPLIPRDFFYDLQLPDGSTRRVPRDAEFLLVPKERCDRVGTEFLRLGDRMRFCRDLALAIGFLHKREVCLGDISQRNLAFNPKADPCVYLVDCDAYRLRGQAPVVAQLHTPDWNPPEGPRVQAETTDRYKLGLFILRVLSPGVRSAQNRDPAWADRTLDAWGRRLLRNALGRDPSARTSAREWYAYFNGVITTRPLMVTSYESRMPVPTRVVANA